MKKISFYLAIFMAFVTLSCQKETLTVATTGGISGSVLDSKSSSALSGVEITISGSDLSATSGSSGEFSFSDLAAGSYTLIASLAGYESSSDSVTVVADETSSVSFSLVVQESGVFFHEASGTDETLSSDLALYFGDDYASTLTSVQIYGTLNEADLLHLGSLPLTVIDIYNTTIVGDINVGTTDEPLLIDGNAIPSEFINGYSYENQNTTLQSVVLPDFVTHVGTSSFKYCSALSSVDLSMVIDLGSEAFSYCSSLVSVDLSGAQTVGYYAFLYCTSLSSIDLPLVEEVSFAVFDGCTSLSSVSLPLVTSIGDYAFQSCSSLSLVDMPMVTSLGMYSFYHCSSLTSLDLPLVTSVGYTAFSYCTSLSSVDLPLVTSVGDYAFCNCTSLTFLELPLVRELSARCFMGCSSLASVSLPLVSSLGNYAFLDCTSLYSVDFPLVTSVAGSSFSGCSSLVSVDLPVVTEIRLSAFRNCSSLSSINLATSSGVKLSYTSYMFANYSNSENAVLTLGSDNSEYVDGNIFTDTEGNEVTFSQIILL